MEDLTYLGRTIAHKKQKLAGGVSEPEESAEAVGDDFKGVG